MKFVLPTLFVFFIFLSAEKLEDHRKSCEYKTVLIESPNFVHEEVWLHVPSEWSSVFDKQCPRKNKWTRQKRYMLRKLPTFSFEIGFSKDDLILKKSPKKLSNDEIRTSLHLLINEKKADKNMLNLIFNSVDIKVSENSEKYSFAPFLNVHKIVISAQCEAFSNVKEIKATVKIMRPDKLLIWKCDDIGKIKNNTYEFYKIDPIWMTEDENGKTFVLNQCNWTTQGQEEYCRSKSFSSGNCSVNNIEQCRKMTITPEKRHGSYARPLPSGMAIYGTFQNMAIRFNGTHNSFGVQPGLFFFSYDEFNADLLQIIS